MNSCRRPSFLAIPLIVAMLLPGLALSKMAKDDRLTPEICSPAVVTKVVTGAEGVPLEVATDGGLGDHCRLCPSAGATPVATLIQLHDSTRLPGLLRVGQVCVQADTAVSIPPATGPRSGS